MTSAIKSKVFVSTLTVSSLVFGVYALENQQAPKIEEETVQSPVPTPTVTITVKKVVKAPSTTTQKPVTKPKEQPTTDAVSGGSK